MSSPKKNSSSQWSRKSLKSFLRGQTGLQAKVVRFLCRPSASKCVQLWAGWKYLAETVQETVLPPQRDMQFFKTSLLVHTKSSLSQSAASATAGSTSHHNYFRFTKSIEKCLRYKKKLTIAKCQSEIDVPLRQNECNFGPLKKIDLGLWKK